MKTFYVKDNVIYYDERDALVVESHKWSVYAYGREGGVKKMYAATHLDGRTLYMHRLLMGAGAGYEVDHVNMNGLDNRRENLRLATKAQNIANKPSYKGSSKFKGVCLARTKSPRWRAWLQANGRNMYLGSFKTEVEAAQEYDRAATAAWGEFARLNIT